MPVEDGYELFGIGKENITVCDSYNENHPVITNVVSKYSKMLVEEYSQLTANNAIEHGIDTGEAAPIKIKHYRILNALKDKFRDEIKLIKDKNIIEPCYSE
ncbi:hypothetical protein AX774_g7908 [Zancudomyces culisetae]|uniref:Uncharacterized protein n=1 Tax=Zancudomyces culisetae TaxID=1213189 RepID=A0A1R1PCJ6_ZANCU|nr:hypothetical protein AX774_g7908 [Zancudomyces culisetae]|eukprot:OMH78696.1 hypothetical protein AX774_g7908 [Zancudomyces culisetae]